MAAERLDAGAALAALAADRLAGAALTVLAVAPTWPALDAFPALAAFPAPAAFRAGPRLAGAGAEALPRVAVDRLAGAALAAPFLVPDFLVAAFLAAALLV